MKRLVLFTSLLTLSCASLAAEMPADATRIKALVKQRLNIEAEAVKKLPIGLYEVVADRNVMYVDKDVKFFVAGHIYDILTQRNLTQIRLDELVAIDPKQLPLDQAVKQVKGNGKRVLYTFSDPYCSYCERLERTLQELDNVTIYTFICPLLGSDEMVDRIFCAKNPAKAWHDWMIDRKEPPTKPESCKTDMGKKNAELTEKLGITGAPTIYFADGSRMEGAQGKESIEKRFASIK